MYIISLQFFKSLSVFLSPFLAVQSSFWPILVSMVLFSLLGNVVLFINSNLSITLPLVSLTLTVLVSFLW